jgi:peptidoglycan hydrolase-like protein with peptidoglycan-binding domain
MFLLANNGQTLTIGSSGSDVWALQVYLITNNILTPVGAAGSKLVNPTSYFGSLTQGALAAYQTQVGITPASGILGPKTRSYLESLVGGTASTATTPVATPTAPVVQTSSVSTLPVESFGFGSTGVKVTTLQTILIEDGYLQAGIFTYGTFDIPTQRAVEVFQCVKNIACSDATPGYGIVGAKTSAALGI